VPADETLFPAATWFARFLRDAIYFDPVPEILRTPAPPGLSERLMGAGENLPWLALRLQDSDPEEFAAWIDHVRTALPQIRDIRAAEREADHFAHFIVTYESGYQVTSPSLSDGTLKILAITLLPFLNEESMPGLLITEEPENGIHPQAIETMLQSLSMLYGAQVLVSTHSPIVLAQTEVRDVLATRLGKDGSVTVVPGEEHPRLRDWRGTIDIGSLFAAGVLS
jgi:predicted ATPase